jgi:hypothetical protein
MDRAKPLNLNLHATSTLEVHRYHNALLHAELAQLLANGEVGYPVYRHQRVDAQIDPQHLLERIAFRRDWQVQRPEASNLVVRTAGAFFMVFATGNPQHCTMSFRLWAKDASIASALEGELLAETAQCRIGTQSLFHLDWRFLSAHGLKEAMTVERPQDTLLDEAYPALADGVHGFIQRYLEAPASVLVLQGPPGGGKTRLIREILRQMSVRKGTDEYAMALYSGEKGVWDTDEIFVEFITGGHDAFLIEDADHLLTPRAGGNQTLHRFLNISDGIAQAQGRKIIFSTNLPNVRDIDPALVRPGRCFAHVYLQELEPVQARRLLERLCGGDVAPCQAGVVQLERSGKKTHSVAEVYAAWRNAGSVKPVAAPMLLAANE